MSGKWNDICPKVSGDGLPLNKTIVTFSLPTATPFSATLRRHINSKWRPLFIYILREVTKYVTPSRRQWARDSGGVRQCETVLLAAGPGEDRIL